MKYFIAILTAVFLASCSCAYHTKRAMAKCGPVKQIDSVISSNKVTDSTRISETLRPDTVYVYVKGPTIREKSPCDSLGNLKPFYREVEKNGIKTTLRSDGKEITAECEADSLRAVVMARDKTIEHLRKEKMTDKKSKTTEVPVYVKSWWDKFTNWFFWIVVALIVGRFGFKYLKRRLGS